MLYNIAEPDKAYDKCHHLLNPFKSNKAFHFYQMNLSNFVFRVVGCCFSFLFDFNRTFCKQTMESPIRHCSLWRLNLVCTFCLCPTKERLANFGLILLLYMFLTSIVLFLYRSELGLDKKRFNHMNRNGVCHMWDRNHCG